MRFLLPSHESLLCIDRFDIIQSDEPEVPLWDILQAILRDKATTVSALLEQLETISVTLRGDTDTDYGFLRIFLDGHWSPKERFFELVWPAAVDLALEMPELFPEGSITCLSQTNPRAVFSRRQVACLVVHQFVCSLPTRPWATDSSIDFHIWFSSGLSSPQTVQAYLQALFNYFERFVDGSNESSPSPLLGCSIEDWPITFTLRSQREDDVQIDHLCGNKFLPLTVVRLPEANTGPHFLGVPHGACVISANKNVGFGSSGTQEETHVGSSPEACPAVLMTPTLRDTEVLIVVGAEAMVSMSGYGREARLDKVLEPDYDRGSNAVSVWVKRTMLFMDALELDMFDGVDLVPDLLPGHVEREIRKAYTAFSCRPSKHEPHTEIFTGLWGCGAFGGDWQVKTIIQWCVAAMGGVSLHFVCAGDQQDAFATSLEAFTEVGLERGWMVGDVLRVLLTLDPSGSDARKAFSYVKSVLSSN